MDSVNKWLTLAANLGVIAGIIFLGVELRQNTVAVQGATYQAMSDAAANQYSDISHDQFLSNLTLRVYGGITRDELTPSENNHLYFHYFAIAQRLENSYLQYQAGLVDERVFDSYGWNDAILSTQHFQDYWNFIGKENSAGLEFNQFFEERIGLASAE